MNRLKCYIVDDEISAIENLKGMLKKYCPEVDVIGHSTTINDAATFLTANPTDVLMLDIRMQNESGFGLLKRLPGFDGSIIFVTAHDEYGIQAFKFSATDYLLKPINSDELIAAIQKAHKKKNLVATQEQIAMLLQSFKDQKKLQQKKIALPDMDEVRYVNIEDIMYCKSSNSYTIFHITGLQPFTVSKPISEYETLLAPYDFIRPHQSYLVNKNKILSYKKEDGGYLYLEDKTIIPVSRQRKHLIKELF